MKPVSQAKLDRLKGHLQNQFKVAVYSIGTGLDENNQRYVAIEIIDENAPDLKTLPDSFEGENVRYSVGPGPGGGSAYDF